MGGGRGTLWFGSALMGGSMLTHYWPPDPLHLPLSDCLALAEQCRIFSAGDALFYSQMTFLCNYSLHNMWLTKEKKKKRVSVWHAAGAWWILACGIRVEYGGRLWMERPVFNLLDRENKSKREWRRWGRELEVRLREAREVREHSWQELPLGPVPVFQRKCRRPNLRPPEEGDLLAPAYCPFYHLVLLMSLSPYGQGLIKKKRHRRHTGVCTCHENGFLGTSEGIVSSRHATLWPDRNPYKYKYGLVCTHSELQLDCLFTALNMTLVM